MRIAAIAFGTRGDVQPALALGRALQARGHQVRVVVSADFADDVRAAGLEVAAANMDAQRALTTRRGHDVIESGNGAGMLTLVRTMKRLFELNGPIMMESAYRASADADAVISSYTSDVYSISIAQKLGIRHISTTLQPAPVATRSGAATPNSPLGGGQSMANLAFHKALIEPFAWRLMSGPTNEFRRDVLRLPEQSRREYQRALLRSPILQGFSPNVVPHPKDWPANIHTTGYWLLDHDLDWAPPRDLLEFLDDGEPPVYIGFGSMTARDSAALTKMLVDAVTAAGKRAVIQSGWAKLGRLPEGKMPRSIHVIDQVSHRWLFHRVSAVVHHGGAGTTATGLRAGLPTVIVPHMGDQPFWGRRVAALGAGPKPISSAKLTSKNLAEAIDEATGDPVIRQRAADLGSRLRAEDGVGTAVTLIEKYLADA